jgi:putative ABC transport system permease protein
LRASIRTTRFRRTLVITEIALAVMLLIGGGLVIHSFVRLASVDPGYDPSHVLTFQVNPSVPPPQRRAFADDVVARFSSLPGVVAAAYGNNIPLVQQGLTRTVSARPVVPGERLQGPFPGLHAVSPGFVATFGMRVVSGRDFGPQPTREALVNRAFVRSGFLGDQTIGRRIYSSADRWWEVVGIVDDVRHWGLDKAAGPEIYIVEYIGPPPGMGGVYFAVRSAQDPLALTGTVRQVIRQQDSHATIDNIASMDRIISNSLGRPRMYAVLLSVFGLCAAALAVIGVYGVLAFAVGQRTREIGLRAALGFLQTLLFGISPLDPWTFAAVSVAFSLVAALASYLPARRATKVDPLVALRCE